MYKDAYCGSKRSGFGGHSPSGSKESVGGGNVSSDECDGKVDTMVYNVVNSWSIK